MSNEIRTAIQALTEELQKISDREGEIKKTINQLASLMGEVPPYTDIEATNVRGVLNIRSDQFFGKSMAGAMKEYLKMRGQAATAKEIHEGLKKGGFEFTGADKFHYKSVALALAKNSKDFVYVKSSNAYGLWEFYPDKKREREKKPIAPEMTEEMPEEATEGTEGGKDT